VRKKQPHFKAKDHTTVLSKPINKQPDQIGLLAVAHQLKIKITHI
jgi:hypothetical protein